MSVQTQRCDKTNLLAAECAHCRPISEPVPWERSPGQPRARPTFDHGPPFEASYEGWCAGCDQRIRAGDLIARLEDNPYAYACSDCCGDL